MIPRVWSGLSLVLACVSLSVSPAAAQYMYLDSNGDGVHTAADQVNPSGPTTIDIWLNTDTNRDGSPAVCSVAPELPLTIKAYVIGLRASNGAISWGTLVNHLPNPIIRFSHGSSATEFGDGYGLSFGTVIPPGLHLLASVSITVASGSPSIEIAPNISLMSDVTSFGSQCYASGFDNTMMLGRDWFDTDGLPFGSGGTPNQGPVLGPLSSMTLNTSDLTSQELTATDSDRQPLAFSKLSGPAFMTVVTRDAGSGTSTGAVALAPLTGDAGDFTGTVSVSDGLASAQGSFPIHVSPGSNHSPALISPDALRVVIGTAPQIPLSAADPDGQGITFQKMEGPDFMAVGTLDPGAGGARGVARFTPGLCDAGTWSAAIGATDGIATDSRSLALQVVPKRRAPVQPQPIEAGTAAVAAIGDVNGDGHADIVTGGYFGTATVLLGRGDGTFVQAMRQDLTPTGEATSITLGDWNGDGRLDLALTSLGSHGSGVFVLRGNGSGGFEPAQSYLGAGFVWTVRSADLDRDGDLDLAVTEDSGFYVLLNRGDGVFEPGPEYTMGQVSRGFALEDFNRDGRPDAAVANLGSHDIVIRFGLGNALFSDPKTIGTLEGAFELIARDWDRDGSLDLAVVAFDRGNLRIYNGDGSGNFTAGAELVGFGSSTSLGANDMDADGDEDLIVAGDATIANAPTLQIAYGNGDGTFQPNRVLSRVDFGRVPSADLNEDGFPDLAVPEGWVQLWLNDAGGAGMPEARAFPESNAPAGGKPMTCVRLEPVATSYRNDDVDPTSLTLTPESGAGSIHAITTSSATAGDTDGNGIAELPASFARDEISALFDATRGRQTVTAHLQGALVDGRRFCTSVSLDILGTGHKLAASVSPNPLNPGGTLRLTTSRDGFVRVRMFDLQGRVVRILEDRAMVPAGNHDVVIDGRNATGQTLASGIYFYHVETVEGSLRGRITVLK